jgi:hypothetical protein
MRVVALALALTFASFLIGVAGDLSATTAQASPGGEHVRISTP